VRRGDGVRLRVDVLSKGYRFRYGIAMTRTRDQLLREAFDQHGFIRRVDALRQGYSAAALKMLVARGTLAKVAHGVYRDPFVPVSPYDNLHLAVLWTGVDSACLSHETVLAVFGLVDVHPDRTHVTVPKDRRIRRAGGEGIELHYEDLGLRQVGWFEQIPTATPATAIAQCIASGTPTHAVRRAIATAKKLGHLTTRDSRDLREALTQRDVSSM
jgi:predicted transcriptional regulator of viral defense system